MSTMWTPSLAMDAAIFLAAPGMVALTISLTDPHNSFPLPYRFVCFVLLSFSKGWQKMKDKLKAIWALGSN